MAFTDHCDLYGAVQEDGVNRAIGHIMRQRPSLFNYATADVGANRKLWCAQVSYTQDVIKYGNPLFAIVDPLPLLGADTPPVAIGFCAQLTEAKIDFHPGNTIALPAELNPPLPEQRFSLMLRLCGSIECPSQDLVDGIPVGGGAAGQDTKAQGKQIVLHGRTSCFCLDVFAIGQIERQLIGGEERLLAQLDDMDIVDIEPSSLEANLICYLKTMVNVVLREKLTIALQTLMLSFPLFGLGTVTLSPTPDPPIPNNPAIEDDQVKAFITMTVI